MTAVTSLALGVAACGGGGTDVSDVGAAPQRSSTTAAPSSSSTTTAPASTGSSTTVGTSPPASTATTAPPATSPPPTAAPAARSVTVWLLRGEIATPVTRQVAAVEGIGAEAVRALLAGPTAAESAAGWGTAIPGDTRLLGLDIDGTTATVDLSSEFESGGGSLSVSLRLAQVVCTLDAFETVDGVRFHLDGEPVTVFSGEGVVLDGPARCSDYDGMTGPSEQSGAAEDGFAVANTVESFLDARMAGSGAEAWMTEDAAGMYLNDPDDALELYGVTGYEITSIQGSGPYDVFVQVSGDGGDRTETLTVRSGLGADGTHRDLVVVSAAAGPA